MPATPWSVGLCAVGLVSVAVCREAFRRRADLPFRVAYVGSWLTLGSGIVMLAQPTEERTVEKLHAAGIIDESHYRELKRKHDTKGE